MGTVDIDDPLVESEVPHVRTAFAHAKTLVVVVCRMHVDNLRSPKRSVANAEF